MSRNRRIKGTVGVALAACMTVGSLPAGSLVNLWESAAGIVTAYAADQTQALTTAWKTSEIGTHDGTGTYTYDSAAKTVTVTGTGTKFDKDGGNDNLYYAYFGAKGDLSITAKITVTGTSGQAGILVKSAADEATSAGAALYADLSKSQVRYGYHRQASGGGANAVNSAITTASKDIYVKMEISGTTATYYVSTKSDFSDATPRVQSGITGLDGKAIGFFATQGVTATFSDVQITSSNTVDSTTTKKIIFDSNTGEELPVFTNSTAYSGSYDAGNSFTSAAYGNELSIAQVRSTAVKGNIRTDTGMDYWLFPATTSDMTITADVTVKTLDLGTDKQGIAMGQFDAKTGTAMKCDVLHVQKNNVVQHTFSAVSGLGASGDPKSNITLGTTYTMTYTKTGNTAYMTVKASDGTPLIDNQSFDLSQSYADLQTGTSVRYGFAFSGVTVDLSNVSLKNATGEVVYDMNDYYVATGVAPVIGNTTAAVSSTRTGINLNWDVTTPGTGNVKYSVYVSKDAGAYTKVGDSKVNSFTYTGMTGDGSYTFKVVPYGGDTMGAESVTSAVVYQAPLSPTALTAAGSSSAVSLTWTAVDNATSYDVYKKYGSDGMYAVVKNTTELSYQDTDVKTEEPYFYYIVAKNSNNTSNPCAAMQVLTSDGHTGTYVYADKATNITVASKSNDTVFAKTANLTLKADEDGTAQLFVNGTLIQTKLASSGTAFSFDMNFVQGRNDVVVLFTDGSGNVTRKTFSFVSKPKLDIVVDAAYTGTDGALTGGYPTFKTVQAAVNSIAADNTQAKVIFIRNGEYNERVSVTSPYVSLLGEDSQKTHLFYSVCIANGNADSMWNRNAMYVDSTATGFTAENLTIENSYAYTNGNDQQADALCIVADQTACVNVRIVGYQDTLLTDTRLKDASGNYAVTRQYFDKCYITGNVDFIYGAGTSVFEDCDIVARYTSYKTDGCYTAGRTYAPTKYGYIFNNCRFLAEDGVADGQFRMGRPWGPDDATTYLNCYLGRAISTSISYGDMSGNLAANARFSEYNSYGPGYAVSNTRPLLTSQQAALYSTSTVFGDYKYADVVAALYKVAPVSTAALETEAKQATETMLAGVASNIYTPESIQVLAAALKAYEAADLSSMSQAEVDTLTQAITSAMNGLVKKTSPTTNTTDNGGSTSTTGTTAVTSEAAGTSTTSAATAASDASAKTGDQSHMGWFAGLAAVSGLAALMMKRKKESEVKEEKN